MQTTTRNEWKYRLNHTLSREQKKRSFDFRKCIIDPLQLFLSSSQHGESIWNGNRGGEGEGWMERRSSVPSVHYLNSSAPYSVSIPIIESEWNRFDTLASRAFPPPPILCLFISVYERNEKKTPSLQLTVEGKYKYGGRMRWRNEGGRIEKLEIYSELWRKFRALDEAVQWGLVCANRGWSYDKNIHLFFLQLWFFFWYRIRYYATKYS